MTRSNDEQEFTFFLQVSHEDELLIIELLLMRGSIQLHMLHSSAGAKVKGNPIPSSLSLYVQLNHMHFGATIPRPILLLFFFIL